MRSKEYPLVPCWLTILLAAFAVSPINTYGQVTQVIANPQLRTVVDAGKLSSQRPPILTPAEKLQQLRKFSGSRLIDSSALEGPLTLTVTNSFIKNRASLVMILPAAVWPDESGGHAGFGDDLTISLIANGLAVKFFAPSPGKYMFDFSVVGSPGSKFSVTQDGSSAAEAAQVLGKHVLLTVEAKQPNQAIIVGLRAQKSWNFYSCEISRVKTNGL